MPDMNIFIFCGPLAFGKGGMEKTAINLANYLAQKNVVTLGYYKRNEVNAPAYNVDASVLKAPWEKAVEGSRNYYVRRVFEGKPDLAIFFGASAALMEAVSLIHDFDIPFIIHEGSNPDRVINDNWARARKIGTYSASWERETIYSTSSAIRFTMSNYVDSLPQCIHYKAFSFPNAFPLPSCKDCQEVTKLNRIINIGGLKPNKNIIPLLHACKIVFEKHPSWELHIFSATHKTGEGDRHLKKINNFIDNYNLQEKVFIHGEVDDIGIEYARSKIHAITSLSEGLNNAICEAMTYGVPSVGLKGVNGVDGVISDERNGLLVAESEFSDALELLINNNELCKKLGKQARKDATMFDPEVVFSHWDNLIDTAIKNHKNRYVSDMEVHGKRMVSSIYLSAVKDFSEQSSCSDFNSLLRKELEYKADFSEIESKVFRRRWSNV
ncbi:glycosyltransferase [Halomonas profundus]|nr:glycosyltransferase [Halomonas profundus]